MKLCSLSTSMAVVATAVAQVMRAAEQPDFSPRGIASTRHLPRQSNDTTGGGGWPYAPFSTKGRDIVNSRGDIMTFAGVNWPMSGETMIPEGLEFASAASILDRIASVGWNVIRFGYAIEMIDQIYERSGSGSGSGSGEEDDDVPLEVALVTALGHANGSRVASSMIAHNPSWTRSTTRFEIWSDLVSLAASRGIYVIPDVHVHKAQWCCGHADGNAWFGDAHFSITNWRRGLAYVAKWAARHPNIIGLSLRNELRESTWNNNSPSLVYNWQTFAGNMTAAADVVHAANPDLLILWSGLQYDQDLSALTTKDANLLTHPCYRCTAIRDAARRPPVHFDVDAHAWRHKLVWELHLYRMSEDLDTGTCAAVEAALYRNGFHALGIPPPADGCSYVVADGPRLNGTCPEPARLTPVVFSEFGHAQDGTLTTDVLQTCLRGFTTRHRTSWIVWSLAGSYRIRSGVQGMDDGWGMTNRDWSGWRAPELIEGWWKPWVRAMNVSTKG